MAWIKSVVVVMGSFLIPLGSSAAIPSANKAAPQKPAKILARQGAISGGLAGNGFSIRDVALLKLPQKERLIIDMGDINGGVLRGLPAYYHAELQENPPRLILDFAQTPRTLLEERNFRTKLKDSKRISFSQMLLDPTDQTMSLIFNLKKGTKAQVFQVRGEKGTGRVVVELQ